MQATRERILSILKERGQATVDELSQELELTAVTVRHHIDILRSEGLVAAPQARRRKAPGRPKHIFMLTEKASALFPKRYTHLISQILGEVRAQFPPDQIDQMVQRIGERIANQADISGENDFQDRLIATVEFLDELGYMAQWEQSDDGNYSLCIANCPYEGVSKQEREVCAIDQAMLTHLLGVPLEHGASAAKGDRQCTYTIHPPTK
ncbi:MAG: ArsR family transcriptional regulator [Chloroflexi bacterium]|nr:ArsR family transcriptional regulator [Chloroflexota bacterium]